MRENICKQCDNKEWISKINSSCSSILKKQKNLTKRWAENLNRHFSKEDIQMAKKQVKRCSMSLLIREMQIKISEVSPHTGSRMTIIKKSTPGLLHCRQILYQLSHTLRFNRKQQNSVKTIILPKRKKVYIKCCRRCREREPSYTLGGNVNWYCCYGEQYGGLLNN